MTDTPTTAELVAVALADFDALCRSIATDIGSLADALADALAVKGA